jgi:hypothetical protein
VPPSVDEQLARGHALSTVAHAKTSAGTISVIIADLLARPPRVHAPAKRHEQARTRLPTGRARASDALQSVAMQATAAGFLLERLVSHRNRYETLVQAVSSVMSRGPLDASREVSREVSRETASRNVAQPPAAFAARLPRRQPRQRDAGRAPGSRKTRERPPPVGPRARRSTLQNRARRRPAGSCRSRAGLPSVCCSW